MRDTTNGGDPPSAKVVAVSRWLPKNGGAPRGFPLVLTIVGVVFALWWARTFLLPLTAAMLLALILYPAVEWLRRLRLSQGASAAFAMLLLLGFLAFVVDATIGPARDWLSRAPELMDQVEDRIRPLRAMIDEVERVTDRTERVAGTEEAQTAVPVKPVAESTARNLLVVTQAVVINLVTIVVLTFFILSTRPASIARAFGAIRGPLAARRVLVVFAALRSELGRYYGTVAVINLGLALAVWASMALLGMPNPMLWGVLAGVLNFIPYVGSAVTLLVLTFVAFVTFDGLGSVLAVSGTYLLLTTLEGQIVQPIAVGRRLAVSPLVVILGLMFWGWLWGVAGVALAIPLMLSIKAVCTHVRAWRPIAEAMTPAPRWMPAPRRRAEPARSPLPGAAPRPRDLNERP